MNVLQMISTLLRQHGTQMTIRNGLNDTEREVKGFFQPARTKSWQNTSAEATPLGMVSQGQYVYIGPAGQQVQTGETLEVGQKDYMLRRVEPVYYGEEIAYYWGMCVEKGGEDTWGQS